MFPLFPRITCLHSRMSLSLSLSLEGRKGRCVSCPMYALSFIISGFLSCGATLLYMQMDSGPHPSPYGDWSLGDWVKMFWEQKTSCSWIQRSHTSFQHRQTQHSSSHKGSTDGPQLTMVQLVIFLTSWRCKSKTHSVETVLRILNLDLFLSSWNVVWYHPLWWCWAVASPRQPCDHKCKQPIHLQPFRTQTTMLFFTFSIVVNPLHEIFNTLF